MHVRAPDLVPRHPALTRSVGSCALLGGEGLGASKTRTRLTFRGGECTVQHGPYAGERELPAAMLILRVGSRDEARSAKQQADLTGLKTEMTSAGVLISAEQLQPSAQGKRLVFDNHQLKVIDGPFSESKELIGGFAILRLPSIEVAIAECRRYAEILGGTLEIDIRPMV